MADLINESDFIFYRGVDGQTHVQVIIGDETVWVTQNSMADIFETSKQNISYHIINILKEGELDGEATVKEILTVQKEGARDVSRTVTFYSLDIIIAVGYRISSYKATQFRIWATKVLKDYLIKGFALDDERLKQGNRIFGKDYFRELLERIREIRTSERMFYEKITDLYATSIDYDNNDPDTHKFFAKVQNKLEYAIVGLTSAEIIKSRADVQMPNMGLQTFKNVKRGGKIQKSDVTIAKNFLKEDELKALNLLVSSFLDHAEILVSKNKIMKMKDWSQRLDSFLNFNEYQILDNAGKVSKQVADAFAEKEYDKFKIIQDHDYKSDFNRLIEGVKTTGLLPRESDTFTNDNSNNKIKGRKATKPKN